jgi:hypothetical protein
MKRTVHKLGFWSAILSAVFSVLWFVTFNMKDVFAAVPDWHDLEAYAETFKMVRFTLVYPSLLLALTYIVMMACLHRLASEEQKIWSLIALSVGILYATMASVNYNVQAVAVRQSLAAGETAGIEMWIPDNELGIFNALANSYVYMTISMVFAGFVFPGGGLERWIRSLFLAQVITAVGQIGWTMLDWSMTIFIATSMVWVIGSPIAFVLLALLFRRRDGEELEADQSSRESGTRDR